MPVAGRLQLFGVARWCGGARPSALPDNLPGYLLAYLAYRSDWIGRDTLIGLFWPDRGESVALHNLRTNLHRVRRLLSDWSVPDALAAEPRRLRLTLPTDVAEFRAVIGRGDWPAAAELQREPLLAALSYQGFPLLEEWAQIERQALLRVWRGSAMKAAMQYEATGQAARACDTLLALLRTCEPTEDAVQALLRVAPDAGRIDEALEHYEGLLFALRNDVGLGPTPETLALARTLRQPGLRPASRAPAGSLVPRAVTHPPRLIGRSVEAAFLADRGHRIVVLAGEPGVGKTRLLEEALPQAWSISCREGLEQVPFGPVVALIDDQQASLPDLGEARRDLARLVPALLDGEQLPPADAAQARPRLLAAIAQLLETRAAAVVFDDLQWADASTRELIVFLARRSTVLLRLAYRSNELTADLQALLDALDAAAHIERIALAPLGAAQLTELLGAFSSAGAGPKLFAGWLHDRTGGNPFFALQTLRSLFEAGQLVALEDGWASALDDITEDYSELQIPSRVEELVRRRVRGLSENARRVLTVIAVAGDARAVEQIATCAELSAWASAEAVAELQSAGLLREHRFAHDLVRQSIYGATPQALRAVLHAAVAHHFSALLRDERIAEHWWLAGNVQQALSATVLATAQQRQAGLHGEARASVERAFGRVTASADRALLHSVAARIRLEQGDFAGAEAEAHSAIDEVAAPPDRAVAFMVMAEVRIQQGRLADADQALAQASASCADTEGLCVERFKLANLQGRSADVLNEVTALCATLRRRAPGRALIQALTSLGSAHAELGRVELGLALQEEAYGLAARLNARYLQAEVAINRVWALSALGRDADACAVAEEALALGEYDSTPTLRNNLVWSLRKVGRIEDAMQVCEQLVAGDDPTLSLIAQARLIDMRMRSAPEGDACAPIDALLARMGSSELYVAHAAAAKTVLFHGNQQQVDRVLGYLHSQPVDPWLYDELSQALGARGIDASAHIGPAPAPH